MFLIILLFWAFGRSEAARCAPGLPGDCPVLQNVTVGNSVCPLGGIRMFCPNNTLAPVYSCAVQGPAGPPPVVQTLPVNSSQCALGGALVIGSNSNATVCGLIGPQGIQGVQGLRGEVGPGFRLDFHGAVNDSFFSISTNPLVYANCFNNTHDNLFMAIVTNDQRLNKSLPLFGGINITDLARYLVIYDCETDTWDAVVVVGPPGPPPVVIPSPPDCATFVGTGGSVKLCNITGPQGPIGPQVRIFPNGTACASFEGATGNITLCAPQGIQGLQGLRGEVGPVFQPHFHGAVNDSYFNLTLNTPIAMHCANDSTHIHVTIVTEDQRVDKSKPVFLGGVTINDLSRYLVIFDCEDLTWDAIEDFLGEQGPPPTIVDLGGGCISIQGIGTGVICNITGPQGIQGIQGIQGPPPTITNIGSGCLSIVGTGSGVVCNVTGPTGATGATGATGQAGTNATISWGNMVIVDRVYGSDSTGVREGLPFRTIAAALAVAQSGDLVQVRPGTYDENSLTVPAGVTLAGLARDRCIISPSSVVSSSTIVTLSTNSIIRDMTISPTLTVHVRLYAIDKSASGSKVERVTITPDNSGAASGGSSDVFGILYNGTAVSAPGNLDVFDVRIDIKSYDFGRKRCYHQEGGGGQYVMLLTCVVQSPPQLRANGTFIGVETAGVNLPVLYLMSSTIKGHTADISETSGRIVLKDTALVNANANGLGFDSLTSLPIFQFSDNGGMNQNSVRYYVLGTITLTTTERWFNAPCNMVVTNLTVTASPGPGGVLTDTWTVRRSIGQAGAFANTAVAATITGTGTSGASPTTVSQHFDAGDRASLQIALSAGTTTLQTRITLAYLCSG